MNEVAETVTVTVVCPAAMFGRTHHSQSDESADDFPAPAALARLTVPSLTLDTVGREALSSVAPTATTRQLPAVVPEVRVTVTVVPAGPKPLLPVLSCTTFMLMSAGTLRHSVRPGASLRLHAALSYHACNLPAVEVDLDDNGSGSVSPLGEAAANLVWQHGFTPSKFHELGSGLAHPRPPGRGGRGAGRVAHDVRPAAADRGSPGYRVNGDGHRLVVQAVDVVGHHLDELGRLLGRVAQLLEVRDEGCPVARRLGCGRAGVHDVLLVLLHGLTGAGGADLGLAQRGQQRRLHDRAEILGHLGHVAHLLSSRLNGILGVLKGDARGLDSRSELAPGLDVRVNLLDQAQELGLGSGGLGGELG